MHTSETLGVIGNPFHVATKLHRTGSDSGDARGIDWPQTIGAHGYHRAGPKEGAITDACLQFGCCQPTAAPITKKPSQRMAFAKRADETPTDEMRGSVGTSGGGSENQAKDRASILRVSVKPGTDT